METTQNRDATKFNEQFEQVVALKEQISNTADYVKQSDLLQAVQAAIEKLQREAVGKIGSGKDVDVPAEVQL